MEVITIQVKEEKVASTVLVTYVIVIIQTNKQKIVKQAEINHYILGHIFFMGTKYLGNL